MREKMGRKPKTYTFNGKEGMTLMEVAVVVDYSIHYVRSMHKKAGEPSSFDSSIFPNISSRLTLNGKVVSILEAARQAGCSETRMRAIIKEHGRTLTSEHLVKPKVVKEFKEEPCHNTAEERRKLARIPGPSPYELKYL